MTTFRVGQRVRIKHGIPNRKLRHLEGREGVLLGRDDINAGHWDINVDGDHGILPNGIPYAILECRLEPLTDSYDLVSWESMRDLWMPEHLREVA